MTFFPPFHFLIPLMIINLSDIHQEGFRTNKMAEWLEHLRHYVTDNGNHLKLVGSTYKLTWMNLCMVNVATDITIEVLVKRLLHMLAHLAHVT